MAPLSILEQQTPPRHTSINRHQHHDECSSPSRGRTLSRRCNRGHEEPPRRESSFLSRASRKVLSVTGRQPRRNLSKVGPAAAEEEGEQRRSRKHSSLLELSRPQQASQQQQTEGQHVHETWYYSANHVLVNRERMMRGIRPLMRSIALDELARTIATLSAQTGLCQPIPSCYHGNVLYGASIRSMHERTMTTNKRRNKRRNQHEHDQKQHRANVLNADFREFGMATHKGRDGQLYLCQLFDQTPIEI
jgi:hypothetical protein